MTDLTSFFKTDLVDDHLAQDINNLMAATLRSEYKDTKTLSADLTLLDVDTPLQRINCNGANRIVKAPTPDAVNNHPFVIVNVTSGAYMITLQSNDGTITHTVLGQGQATLFLPDGNGGYFVVVDRIPANQGWTTSTPTWSYSSVDGHTSVVSVNADMTGVISVGMKIRFVQTTTKYFMVTAVGSYSGGATLITLYGGTDYTVANAAIASPYYSASRAPFGFPMDPDKWSETFSDANSNVQTSPTANTTYNPGSLSIAIPIGKWIPYMEFLLQCVCTVTGSYRGGISSSNNSESNAAYMFSITILTTGTNRIQCFKVLPVISLAAKTTHYFVCSVGQAAQTSIGFLGTAVPTQLKLVCAYL